MNNSDLRIMFTDFYFGKEMPILIIGEVLSVERTYSTTTGRDILVIKFMNDVDTYISDENFLRKIMNIGRGKAMYRDLNNIVTVFGKIKIFVDPFMINTYKMYIDIENEDIEIPSDILEIIEKIKDLDNIISKFVLKKIHTTLLEVDVDLLYDKDFLDDDDFIKIYKRFKDEKIIPEILREDFLEIYGGN